MTINPSCHPQQLEQLLNDTLPEKLEEELVEHLASCAECRTRLELLAADWPLWAEIGQRLNQATFPLQDSEQACFPLNRSQSGRDPSQFAVDFAVDFLEPADDPSLLGRLGDYDISGVIGRGGMGLVLKGYQPALHRPVAVKVLLPHLAISSAARRRFAREAQATAAVVHPHVMAIHAVHADGRLPYLVMPLVPCESLQERLDRQAPLGVNDILRIGLQTALGLAAAHAQGIVHRDVKPANILLESNVDRVLLTDFGLARAVDDASLTRTGTIAGTPLYMSPEQAGGEAIDHRSDLFSLGAVLYAMSTGRPPFRAETTFGVLRKIRETSPRSVREINPEIPEWLERVILQLLEKESSKRFSTATDVAHLLEQCLAHVQQPTVTPLPVQLASDRTASRSRFFSRKRNWAWFVGGMFVVTAFSLIRVSLFPAGQSPMASPSQTPELPAHQTILEWDALRGEMSDIASELNHLEADFSVPFETSKTDSPDLENPLAKEAE